MIVQAIALLDDLDKEINIYAMRTKVRLTMGLMCFSAHGVSCFNEQEWYGWHFPEMAKIISDNQAYAKCIIKMGEHFLPLSPIHTDGEYSRLPHERCNYRFLYHPP